MTDKHEELKITMHSREAATRLRDICKTLGLASAVPADDETLIGALFAVLGQVRFKLEKRIHDRQQFDKLRSLCGYVENGSDETVTLFQDDATRDWVIKIGGKRSYHASSLSAAVLLAHEKENPEGE